MSKVDVIMPQMGESIAEGTLTRWIKAVGDAVDRDEDLFEISTDKVDADIPSPAAGVLVEVLVQEGETVEVNTIVARIETDAAAAAGASATDPESAEAEAPPPADSADGNAAARPSTTEAPAAQPAAASSPGGPAASDQPPSPQPTAPARPAGGPETREERLRTRSTPLVRKIAAEHGVDIGRVSGSGAGGRVTRDDLLGFLDSLEPDAPAATTPTVPSAATAGAPGSTAISAPAATEAPAKSAAAAPAETPQPGMLRVPIHGATLDIKLGTVPVRENDRVEEMSRVRLRTMEHMLMSKRVSAHVTSVSEVDFEHVVQLRRKLKAKYLEQGVKLTYGPFVYRAVVEALREYPILNASVDGTRIVYHSNINLGIAVAVNDGTELIVPVLKDADRLSLMGLAQGANEIAERARNKTLGFDDIQGGTFTITNVGVFGNLFGTPIINQPQVAILGTGVIEKRPVVVQDELGNDVIAIRHRAYFGLSYDHRVVDGAMAAFFLNKVQDYLESFPDEG